MQRHRPGFTLIELMIVVAIIGLLAAIAIPQFLRFQQRAKQTEVKANLRTIYVSELSYSHEHDTFTDSLLGIGYAPERGNRYSYILSSPTVYWPRSTAAEVTISPATNAIEVDTFKYSSMVAQPAPLFTPSVVRGPTGSFVVVGVGNIDPHGPLDEWSIASLSRVSGSPSSATACAAGNSPPSDPCQDQGSL